MNLSGFNILKDSKKNIVDSRGWLEILFENNDIVLKRSHSKAGVFRGMHYQKEPNQQTKIIRVIEGEIIDFIADPEIGLSSISQKKITSTDGWVEIKKNFAHGFYAVSDVIFEYICIGKYSMKDEISINIENYLKGVITTELIMSEKDKSANLKW